MGQMDMGAGTGQTHVYDTTLWPNADTIPGIAPAKGRVSVSAESPSIRTAFAPTGTKVINPFTVRLRHCEHPVVARRFDGRLIILGGIFLPWYRIAGIVSGFGAKGPGWRGMTGR